jgi:transcriptional regulator with XRE-family HTH domain
MKDKEISTEIGARLKQIREANRLSIADMARQIGVYRESYARNERGATIPSVISLSNLGYLFDISLDWLIMDKGPMIFTEKTGGSKAVEQTAGYPPLSDEIKELLDYMGKIPLLRHEILSHFYRFKEEHQGMMERAIK